MPPRSTPTSTTGSKTFFVGAPLTKITGAVAVIAYFAARSSSKQGLSMLAFDALRIRDKREIYRYFSSLTTFSTTGELIPGGLLFMYFARQFEREMGSRKATMFTIFVHSFAMALETFLVPFALYHDFNLRYTGPYAMIGAYFYLFHRYTPRITPTFFSMLGFNFSDKLFHYIWFLQVSGSAGFSSGLMVGIGAMAAMIYEKVPLLRSLDVPDSLASVVGNLTSHIADGPPRTVLPGRGGGAPPVARAAAAMAAAAATAAPPPQPPRAVTADPEAIEQLTMMGFPRPLVEDALKATNNDVQRAADRLLTQQ